MEMSLILTLKAQYFQDSSLWGCKAMSLGECFLTYLEITVLHLQGQAVQEENLLNL